MAFTVVISTGYLVDYSDDDSYAVNENGALTITIAHAGISTQIYSPNGWLELVETAEGAEIRATRAVIGHSPR
jgi:hypothetical protein